jgi:hypothetical protein
MRVKEGGADSKPGLRDTTSESSKPGQEGSAAEPGVRTGDRYERMQAYTFLVPDKWEVVPPEHFHDLPDTWEIVPLPPVRALYIVLKGQNRRKARLCFQTVQDDKKNLESNLFDQLESEGSKSERWLRERLHVDTYSCECF